MRSFLAIRVSSGCVLMAALCVAAGCTGNQTTPVTLPPPVVEVALPIDRQVTDHEIFTARTAAVQSVDIKARVTGFLMKLGFEDGKDVTENQILFHIDDRPYKAALDKANADVETAKAALVKTQSFLDIGLAVQKQNPAAISQQELDRRKGSRDEAVGQVKQAQAEVEEAQLNFDWCKVRSPMNGRASRHLVSVGDLVTQNMTLLTNVVSIQPLWAYFDVDQNAARSYQKMVEKGQIQSARDGKLPVQMAVGNSTQYEFAGVVDFVNNQVDPNTASVRLRAVFANDGKDKLLAGNFCRVRVPISAPHSGLLVADSAIGSDQGQQFILVVNDKNEVEYRAVTTGQLHTNLREVKRTRAIVVPGPDHTDATKEVEVLKPTDRIIVNGLQRVRPGIKVEPKLVDMATMLPVGVPAEAKK